MTRLLSKDLNFSFNAIAIEDELNNVGITFTLPEGDITAFADVGQNFLGGGKKNTVTELSGTLDMALAQGDATIFGAMGGGTVSTVLNPTGVSVDSNNPEYQCTASGLTGVLVANHSISLPVGGVATYSTTLQHSGSTTRAVA